MSTAVATTSPAARGSGRALPPVLGRLLSASFWLALRVPLQAIFALWTTRLIVGAIGPGMSGAYKFAWGFGFFQMLFEFGISSALQRQISDSWTRDDRDGVNRAVACGLNFYAAMALVQVAALLAVIYGALPYSQFAVGSAAVTARALGEGLLGDPLHGLGAVASSLREYDFIAKLLWLQILTAPCYGLSVVVASVLQAARRYDFIPRLEVAITILRFLILLGGVVAGIDFYWIVIGQIAVQVGLSLVPGLWVMVRELGQPLRFRGARLEDYKALGHISFYMALIQISVVLGDKIDTTILGFMHPNPGQATAIYDVVSKPFLQLRQTGWMLAYMVMPAVASLAAARDLRGLERVKYDGTRLHVAVLLPVGLLAWIYAAPFLSLWMGARLGQDAGNYAGLMRLFLTAALPLVLSVPVQMAIGINRIKVIALAAIGGALINLPISCYLTARIGVAGVIWGTVLTTFFSNLVLPGLYVFRVLELDPRTTLTRTLGAPLAGGLALVAATWLLGYALPIAESAADLRARTAPLLLHLTIGTAAYAAGYLAAPYGRRDLAEMLGKLRRS
ncbi:Polysaccharide biosynthesis protein [Aquisphaera giovannonii]|uniref:Polysaccharide biosynthesis protein n=1 Tax=Aquisphaera giovannonii TaxID=406548 RepID=A0A5B9WCP8_9BACT|nr:polysaccharide biosynthesis C-terminal domain-containing protein [Aquisphaera giovannonii]QEH38044.1 Polysaccharide biosynthesis protein [Aquisphaera giovannonii]